MTQVLGQLVQGRLDRLLGLILLRQPGQSLLGELVARVQLEDASQAECPVLGVIYDAAEPQPAPDVALVQKQAPAQQVAGPDAVAGLGCLDGILDQ